MFRYLITFLCVVFFTNSNFASSSKYVDVLIVGAGPAGLTLGLTCQKLNLTFIIVDQKKHFAYNESKATGIHADSMIIFEKLGVDEKIKSKAIKLTHKVARMPNDQTEIELATQDSYKNYSMAQGNLEIILAQEIGSNIKYGSIFKKFFMNDDFYYSDIDSPTGNYTIKSKFLVGADGGKSAVRKELIIKEWRLPDSKKTVHDNQQIKSTIKIVKGIQDQLAGKIIEKQSHKHFSIDAIIENGRDLLLEECKMYTIKNNHNMQIVLVPIQNNQYKISGKISDSIQNAIENLRTQKKRDRDLQILELIKGYLLENFNIVLSYDFIKTPQLYATKSWSIEKMVYDHIVLIGDAAHMFLPIGGYGMNLAIKDGFFLALALKGDDASLDEFDKNSQEATRSIHEILIKKHEPNSPKELQAKDPRMSALVR